MLQCLIQFLGLLSYSFPPILMGANQSIHPWVLYISYRQAIQLWVCIRGIKCFAKNVTRLSNPAEKIDDPLTDACLFQYAMMEIIEESRLLLVGNRDLDVHLHHILGVLSMMRGFLYGKDRTYKTFGVLLLSSEMITPFFNIHKLIDFVPSFKKLTSSASFYKLCIFVEIVRMFMLAKILQSIMRRVQTRFFKKFDDQPEETRRMSASDGKWFAFGGLTTAVLIYLDTIWIRWSLVKIKKISSRVKIKS